MGGNVKKSSDISPASRPLTRSHSSSPISIRKSPRLQNLPSKTPTPTPTPTPNLSNKNKKNKNKCNKGSIIIQEKDNMTLKDIVKDVRDSSPNLVVDNRKIKRLHARRFKDMFDFNIHNNIAVSQTNSKKRRLDSCYDNVDSGLGGSLEVVLESCGKSLDSGHLKSEEGLEVKCDDNGDNGLGASLEVVLESCGKDVDSGDLKSEEDLQVKCGEHGGSGGNRNERGQENYDGHIDRGIEEPTEEPLECSDGEEIEKDCARNTNDCIEKPCELENGEGVLNLTSPFAPRTQDEKNSASLIGEVNGSVVEKLPNQEVPLGLSRVLDNVNGPRSCQEALPVEAFVAGGEEFARCSNKQRSDHDSLRQEPCGCVSNPMGGANSICVSKDRGECSNARDENVQKTDRGDSAVDRGSIVPCKHAGNLLFQEYWIPVEISNVQLEQYCSFMLSNSAVLRSCSKSDPIGSLHDILLSMQKCCDHPYIVNPSLRKSLLPEHPSQDAALDMGVKASGKLQLLDKLLSEFRNLGLKVVILFQSIGGSGKDNLEFLLDDLLTWRFGKDSFEHVAVGGQPKKKNAALNKFNTESNISFLLLETRACLPSIKLSLVDSVIILNSDWNPLNDIRALQKIMIDSKLKPIKVYRLYCSCTIEEKALIIAKNGTILDNTAPMNPSTKQMLLMWGSSYLFSRLDEFHRDNVLNHRDNVALESSFMTDVFQEIISLLKKDGTINPSKYISEARRDGRCYPKNTLLFGEQITRLEEGIPSHTYWTNLLEGKQPQWKFLSMSSERNRKRVDYSDDLSLQLDGQTDEPVKKRKDSSPRQTGHLLERLKDKNKEHHGLPDTRLPAQDDRSGLHDQKGLFKILKPSILRLCETLMLKEEVKTLAERFLEYVINNHRVTREPETILEAFQISVCWTAAEVLEEYIDHRKSLDIAVEKMYFKCLEQEVDSVNRKMKLLMKIFLSRNIKILKSCIDPNSATNDGTCVLNKSCVNISIGSQEKISITNKEVRSELHMSNKEKDSVGDVEMVKNNREKKIQILKERQNDEIIKFDKSWQEKRAVLEDNYKVESAVIRYSYAKSTDVVEKLKILENDYAKKRENLESQICNHRKEFEARQKEERDAEQKMMAQLLELPSVNTIRLQTGEHVQQGKDSNGFISVSGNLPEEEQNSGEEASGTACQDLGDGQHRVEGEEVQVHPLTESYSTLPRRELSLSDPANSVSSPLPHNEGTSVLPAIDHSLAVDVVHSCGYDQNSFASNGQLNNQPTEAQTVVQNSCTQMQHQRPQSGVVRSVDVTGASIAHISHPNPVPVLTPTISRMPSSYHSDPLQNEFDRIRKQMGEIIIAHEEKKLRLKSECDKEIEELVAQIRRKHYAKLEEVELLFSLKKNELEKNHNLVMMNKFLADAFRSKCMDYKAGSQERTQEGMSSSSIEFPFELQPTTTPFSVSASFSIAPSAARPNRTPPPVPTVSHHMNSSSGGFDKARHETRPPAPHLQHTSVPPAMSPSNNNLASPSSPQIPAKLPHQPPAFQSTHVQSHQPETFARESALSLSATELLMEIARRNDTNLRHLSNNLPPWPDNMQDDDSSDLSQFGRAVDVEQPNGDVVCLSDDD